MDLVEEVCVMMRREGLLVGLGEELGVIDFLAGDKRQHAGADTNEFCVSVAHKTETETPFFSLTRKTCVGWTRKFFLSESMSGVPSRSMSVCVWLSEFV